MSFYKINWQDSLKFHTQLIWIIIYIKKSTSSNSTQFRDTAVKRHLSTLEPFSNTRTRPRFLTSHTKPTTVPLSCRDTSSLSLPFLSRPWLWAQIVQPEPRSWRCSNHRRCCCLIDYHRWSFVLRMECKTSEVACLWLQSRQVSLSLKKKKN
jgi:hypothetical protein